ncbi:MAG: hypothetical protein JW934_16455 [Anaerolineae bacterium]|nr:hypothetical protein [Anaerolineae bacterium]
MAEQKERVFKYNDQEWADPGAGYSNEDVRKQLATFFPELAQAGIQTGDLPDGRQQVEFVKRSGTKGIDIGQFPLGADCPFCGEPIPVADLPEGDGVIVCPNCAEVVDVICHVTTWYTLEECAEDATPTEVGPAEAA